MGCIHPQIRPPPQAKVHARCGDTGQRLDSSLLQGGKDRKQRGAHQHFWKERGLVFRSTREVRWPKHVATWRVKWQITQGWEATERSLGFILKAKVSQRWGRWGFTRTRRLLLNFRKTTLADVLGTEGNRARPEGKSQSVGISQRELPLSLSAVARSTSSSRITAHI